jgi:hypothetical protein
LSAHARRLSSVLVLRMLGGDTQTMLRHPVRPAVLVAVAGMLIFVASATGRQTLLRTGSTKYVRVARLRGGDHTVVLTAQGRKVLRGRVLQATCTTLGRSVHGLTPTLSESSASEGGGPRRGNFAYHTISDLHADFCDIRLVRRTRGGISDSVNVPPFDSLALDQRGAVFLNEDRVTQRLAGILELGSALASKDPAGDFPTAPRVASYLHGRDTSLSSPSTSPPPGRVGFFSDGVGHVEVVGLSALGRRLYVDLDDGVLSTDVPEHLLRVATNQVDTLPS